jgi:hypothetical protein
MAHQWEAKNATSRPTLAGWHLYRYVKTRRDPEPDPVGTETVRRIRVGSGKIILDPDPGGPDWNENETKLLKFTISPPNAQLK